MKLFNQDIKHYKAQESALTVKSICWAILSVIVIVVCTSRMEEEKTSFVAEQFIKHQEMRK